MKFLKRDPLKLLSIIALLAITGCVSPVDQSQMTVNKPTRTYPVTAPQDVAVDSLYGKTTALSFFEDNRAAQVGDLISVLLVEETMASKSSDTNISKNNETSIGNPSLGGKPVDAGGGYDLSVGIESEQKFSGQSGSNQSNSLEGTITATVAAVLPRGNLVIEGEKWIQINQDNEYIRIRGVVRQVDISTSNTILSTQVGNAEIEYGGTGPLARANSMGWLSRFFNSPIWPF